VRRVASRWLAVGLAVLKQPNKLTKNHGRRSRALSPLPREAVIEFSLRITAES
jgi:hypothetical protein